MDEKNTTLEEPLNKNFREPKIRFPEFHDSWKKYKISDICIVTAGGTPNTTIKSYWDGDIDWFTPTEVGKSKFVDHSNRQITDLGLKKSGAKLINKNSILMTSRASIGLVSINLNDCTTNQGFQSLTPLHANLDFVYYLVCTKNFQYKLMSLSNKSTFNEISNDSVSNIEIWVPCNSEQYKIGSLFSQIDAILQTNQNKIETLKKYKEGLVNDWFSNDSNKVQLKSLVNQKPSPLLKSHFKENSGQYPVYDASGQPYTTIDFYNNDQDSIAIIKYGSGCGNTFITRNKHSVLGTMSELIPKDKELLEYIYAYTLSKQFRKICTRYTEIGTTPNLYFSDYSEEYIYIPKEKDKTKKFIEVFKRIEEEESICQNKLSVLSQIKAYLLKNMFI